MCLKALSPNIPEQLGSVCSSLLRINIGPGNVEQKHMVVFPLSPLVVVFLSAHLHFSLSSTKCDDSFKDLSFYFIAL